jgi:hypothetical protein
MIYPNHPKKMEQQCEVSGRGMMEAPAFPHCDSTICRERVSTTDGLTLFSPDWRS